MALLNDQARAAWHDIGAFSHITMPDRALRGYQLEAARPLARHIMTRSGEQFAVVFSRQAGKDEMLAQLLT